MCLEEKKRQAYLALIESRLDRKRVQHTLGVEKEAMRLVRRYGGDMEKAQIAALLHDVAKKIKKKEKLNLAQIYNIEIDPVSRQDPGLLHGPLAAEMMRRELGISDPDILNAVRYHTTGRENMSRLEKIIYLADLIEEGRDFPGVEGLRELAEEDLDTALLEGMRHVLLYLVENRSPVQLLSIEAYNDLLKKKEK